MVEKKPESSGESSGLAPGVGEPPLSFWMSFFMGGVNSSGAACGATGSSAGEVLGELGLGARFRRRDHVAPHQVGQVLVEGLHAHAVAGLDRRVHLGDLVLAD